MDRRGIGFWTGSETETNAGTSLRGKERDAGTGEWSVREKQGDVGCGQMGFSRAKPHQFLQWQDSQILAEFRQRDSVRARV